MSSCWIALAGEAVDGYRCKIVGHTCGTHLATLKIKIPNKFARYYKENVDMETVKKNPAEKAAKTKQNTKSKLAINTWALTLKIKIPNKFASCLN
jgi:hypothetical protein